MINVTLKIKIDINIGSNFRNKQCIKSNIIYYSDIVLWYKFWIVLNYTIGSLVWAMNNVYN